MGNTLTSPKGGPLFTNTPTQTATDLNAGRIFVEKVGNRVADTSANRTTAVSPNVWEGLMWYETDTGLTYQYQSGAWVFLLGDTGWITPSLASGWTGTSGEVPQYRRINGIVYLQGRATSTGATISAFTLPVGFRSGYNRLFAGNNAGAFIQGEVFSTGGVGCTTTVAATNFSFGACPPWPADA